MKEKARNESYAFWRHPWGKWCVLAGAVLQLPAIGIRLREYRMIVNSGVFSEEARAEYIAGTRFGLACSGLLVALLLGEFLVGCLVRSRKQEWLAEGVLFLISAAVWSAACLILDLYSTRRLPGMVFLVLLLGCGGYFLYKWRRQE